MFITECQVMFIILMYIAVLVAMVILVLASNGTDYSSRWIKVALLLFLPVFGIIIIGFEYFYRLLFKKK